VKPLPYPIVLDNMRDGINTCGCSELTPVCPSAPKHCAGCQCNTCVEKAEYLRAHLDECPHEGVGVNFTFNRIEPDDMNRPRFMFLEVAATCLDCGQPLRFVGVEAGGHFSEPRVDATGTAISLPVVPGASLTPLPMTFVVPPGRDEPNVLDGGEA
jgi:hypothetical protein